jgi:iron(III) transport system substrate-binding protein
VAAWSLTACSGSDDALTLYNAQHEDLMQAMIDGFTEETGIDVQMRSGSDFELANQIIQEGSSSPADVFVTENSPAMSLVDSKEGFAKVDDNTLAQVPSQFAPSSKNWVGFAARSTVLAYNKNLVTPDRLPLSISDLAKPEWKNKVGFAPAGADFQAIVSAFLVVNGEPAAKDWLSGMKDNAKAYRGNIPVMQAVNAGEIEVGVIYHYYWYKDRAEAGTNSQNTELHYFDNKDAGAFLSVSGAGVVKASKKSADAQRFVNFINGPKGQEILAGSKALEYPVGNNAPASPSLKPLNELDPPLIDISTLNGPKVTELMRNASLL